MNCLTTILSLLVMAISVTAIVSNVTVGAFIYIYDPSVGELETNKWYINDHTFIKDQNGTWHLFGITHKEPADPDHEIVFAHATAKHLLGPWIKQVTILCEPNQFQIPLIFP